MDSVFQLEAFDSFLLVIDEIVRNLHRSSEVPGVEIESNVIEAAKNNLRNLIIKYNFDIETVAEQIVNNDWNEERIKYFVSLLKEKKKDILHSILTYHNRSYTETLVEFDWLLKLVLGSNELKSLRYPLLQVLLCSVNSNGDQKQRLYEFNKESLCKVIKTLDNHINDENSV